MREGQISAVPAAGVLCREFCCKANDGNYADFPGRAREKFGKAPMFADSAPRRESAKVRKFPESRNGEAIPEYFPPHAPELNPAGVRWGRSSARRQDLQDARRDGGVCARGV